MGGAHFNGRRVRRVAGHEIPEEPKARGASYFVPNEFNTRLFSGAFYRVPPGAVVTTGGLRAFSLAGFVPDAWDNTQPFVIIDHDSDMTTFCDRVIDLFVESDQLELFVDVLAGRASASAPFFEGLPLSADKRSRFTRAVQTLCTEFGRNVLNDPRQFKRGKELAHHGLLVPLNGSFLGEKTLNGLADVLVSAGIPVSLLDLSNILEHLQVAPSGAAERLLANLSRLPWNDDAIALITIDRMQRAEAAARGYRFGRENSPDGWSYVRLYVSDLLQALRNGFFNSEDSYHPFIEQILQPNYHNGFFHHPPPRGFLRPLSIIPRRKSGHSAFF